MWNAWERGEVHTGLSVRKPEEKDYLEDLGVGGRIILKCIFKKYDGGVEWIDLAHDRDKLRAFVNMLMNLQVL